ncbi:MAG: DUF4290 domain-containing protein [Bacteroidales bacterium]|jgi:hypothetical protein|nr:DUF4290 domain-containing protein [Bacteroidales bacterium]
MDYNTQREKLKMPEYGRHIQDMIEYVMTIEDRDKRNEQIKAVINAMGVINAQQRDGNSETLHKLWDHVHIISDYKIDIESPYPAPERKSIEGRPAPVVLDRTPIKAYYYGRNIQNMVKFIADMPDGQDKTRMIKTIATYMQQRYLIWNKELVSEGTIFKDLERLSEDRIKVPQEVHIGDGVATGTKKRPGTISQTSRGSGKGGNYRSGKSRNNKYWKNNK